jgi:hypothetical protein
MHESARDHSKKHGGRERDIAAKPAAIENDY